MSGSWGQVEVSKITLTTEVHVGRNTSFAVQEIHSFIYSQAMNKQLFHRVSLTEVCQ